MAVQRLDNHSVSATRQHMVRSKSNTGDGSSNKRNAAAEEIKIPANRMM